MQEDSMAFGGAHHGGFQVSIFPATFPSSLTSTTTVSFCAMNWREFIA